MILQKDEGREKHQFVLSLIYAFIGWFFKLIWERGKRERGGDREKYQLGVLLVYAFIHCFLYVPWSGIRTATLKYGHDALTNWHVLPGPLVDSCTCPNWELDLKPWHSRRTLKPTEQPNQIIEKGRFLLNIWKQYFATKSKETQKSFYCIFKPFFWDVSFQSIWFNSFGHSQRYANITTT